MVCVRGVCRVTAANEGLTPTGLSGIKVTWRLLSVFILILTDAVVVLIVRAVLLWRDYGVYLVPSPSAALQLYTLFSCCVNLLNLNVCIPPAPEVLSRCCSHWRQKVAQRWCLIPPWPLTQRGHSLGPPKKGKQPSVPVSNVVDYTGLVSHLPAAALINPAACFVPGQRSSGGQGGDGPELNYRLNVRRRNPAGNHQEEQSVYSLRHKNLNDHLCLHFRCSVIKRKEKS